MKAYVGPFALGLVLAAAITGGLLFRRHRMQESVASSNTHAILSQLRALPYVRTPAGSPPPATPVTRIAVVAWPRDCGCTARIDAAVRLIAEPAPSLTGPLIFVSNDPTPVDVTARLRDQRLVSSNGDWEQHLDAKGDVFITPFTITGLTALVLDGNGQVISRHSLGTEMDYENLAEAVYTGRRAPGAVTVADVQAQLTRVNCSMEAHYEVGSYSTTVRLTLTVARSGILTILDAKGDDRFATTCMKSEVADLRFPRHELASEPLVVEKTFTERIVY